MANDVVAKKKRAAFKAWRSLPQPMRRWLLGALTACVDEDVNDLRHGSMSEDTKQRLHAEIETRRAAIAVLREVARGE